MVLDVIGLGQDPRAVVERAIDERKSAESDHDAERDSYWTVFDRDKHVHFCEAINLGIAAGIDMAISNPCFELWAILHYEPVDAPLGRHEAQERLRELCPTYSRSNKRFQDRQAIETSHHLAVERARGLAGERGDAEAHDNPSTTVSELTEQLRIPDA